jgi:hypothetical protein
MKEIDLIFILGILRCLREGVIRIINVTLSQVEASIMEYLLVIQQRKDTVVIYEQMN